VRGISEAIIKSKGKKVFVCNLMTQEGNTDKFSVEDFIEVVEEYLGKGVIDYKIFNTGKLEPELLKKAKKMFPKTDFIRYDKKLMAREGFVGEDLLDRKIRQLNSADILVRGANQRTIVFHDSNKLAKIILSLCK
jgi:uncharacterized cofD-like protein